jgi:hypothetical protein
MPYDLPLPNGDVVRNIPDDVPVAQAKRIIVGKLVAQGQLPAEIGDIGTRTGATLASGIAGTLSVVPNLYGVVTGDYKNAPLAGTVKNLEEYAGKLRTPTSTYQRATIDQAVEEAGKQGVLSQVGEVFKQYGSNPSIFIEKVGELAPDVAAALLTGGATAYATFAAKLGLGAVGKQAAKEGAEAAARTAAAKASAQKVGTNVALGQGAIQEGASSGKETYDEVFKNEFTKLVKSGVPEAEAKAQAQETALTRARAVAGATAGVTLLASKALPGIEKTIFGGAPAGRVKSATTTGLGEAAGETAGATTGQVGQNIAAEAPLTRNVGRTIGESAALGGGAGAVTGAVFPGRAGPAAVGLEAEVNRIIPQGVAPEEGVDETAARPTIQPRPAPKPGETLAKTGLITPEEGAEVDRVTAIKDFLDKAEQDAGVGGPSAPLNGGDQSSVAVAGGPTGVPGASAVETPTSAGMAQPVSDVAVSPTGEGSVQSPLEPAPEVKVEPAPEVKVEPAPEVKVEPAPEVKVEPAPEVTPEPSASVRSGVVKLKHASLNNNLKSFDKEFEGDRYEGNGGTFGSRGVYLDNTGSWTDKGNGLFYAPNVYEVDANFKKAFVLSPNTVDALVAELPPNPPTKLWSGDAIVEVLRDKGYDGLIVEGFGPDGIDPYGPDADKFADLRDKFTKAKLSQDITQDQVFAFDTGALSVSKNIRKSATPPTKRETKAQRVEREQRESDEALKTFSIPRSAPSAGSQQVAKSARGVNLNQVPELDLDYYRATRKLNDVMSKPGSQRTVEEQAIHAYAAGVQGANPKATIKDVFRYLAYELAEPSSVGAKQRKLSESARVYVEKALGRDATKKLDAAVSKVKENVAAADEAAGRLTSDAGLESRRGEEREAKPETELNLQEMLKGVSESYEGTRSGGKAVRGAIAELLSGIGAPPRVVFGEVEDGRAGKFDPKTNTITLNKDKVTEDVLLHEAVHAYIDHAIDNPGKLNANQKRALEELKSLHKLAVDRFGADFDIGPLKEFAAEVMSNPELQAQMRQVKVPTKPFTFLGSFARTVAKLLNIPIAEQNSLFLRSVSEIESLLSAPTAKVKGKEVSYAPEKKARTFRIAGKDIEIGRPVREPKKLSKRQEGLQKKKAKLAAEKQAAISNVINLTEGKTGLVIRKLADSRRIVTDLEYKLAQAGKLVFDTADKAFNAVDSALTASSGKTTFLVMDRVKPLQDLQYKIVDAIAKREGSDVKQVFDSLNSYFTVLHESERRLDKFIRTVSLEPHNEVRRYNIREELSKDNKLSVKEARKLYDEWVELVRDDRVAQEKDISSDEFSVTGMKDKDGVDGRLSSEEAANILGQFKDRFKEDPELAKLYKLAEKTQQELNKVTIDLNRKANYGSQGLQNLINARGWKHYVPFRGAPGSEKSDEASNYSDVTNVSGEMAQVEKATQGRISAPENVLLRSFAESVKAAARVPQGDVTKAVYNLVKNGQVEGDIKTIRYQDRVLKDANPPREDNVIYHYADNGDLHAIEIKDTKLATSIRGTYTKLHPFVEGVLSTVSTATRLQGSFMTRYNPGWWPVGFVTDVFTNWFNISADSPVAGAKYIGRMAYDVVATKGFAKSARLAHLYNTGRVDEIRRLAEKPGSWYADALEWLEQGGKISFSSGFSSKSQLEQLESRLSRNPLTVSGRAVDDVIGLITDSLDITTRVAAYRVFKAQGLPPNKAAVNSKELANFERSGDWGRGLGAAFTFFRPSAIGATRAIDSITRGKYGKQTAVFAAGLGASLFFLTRELSDDDEEGRNRVQEDDGDRSVRRLRIYIPGMENPIQIPWSYGIGGFAAVGYQAAKAASGSQTWLEYANNTQKILRESFLPLPVSQINPLKSAKNFAAFLIDSILPSTLRPIGQTAFNMNSLDTPIFKEGPSRYAQAYVTGKDIPDWIEDFTKHIYQKYEVDLSPRFVHHILSNYVSGLSGVMSDVDGLIRTAKGDKELTARDIPGVKGFIGTESSKDNKRFEEFSTEMKRIENAVNTFKKRDPEVYAQYLEKNPSHESAVKYYNHAVKNRLDPLYKESNFIRSPKSGLNEKERKEMLDDNRIRQRQAMRSIMEESQWMLAD